MMRNFILGTDWCTDCDDAVAVRILARAHKSGKICIKGIGVNACMEYSAASLDGFLNTEGVKDIPIGIDLCGTDFGGKPLYQKNLVKYALNYKSNNDAEDAVTLYRRILSQSKHSIEIVEIGYLQVISAVLESKPDDISEKSGIELIADKVTKIWSMAGKWDEPFGKEYNFACNARSRIAGNTFCKKCPVPITFLGWEVGNDVITGDNLDKNDILYQILSDHGSPNGRMSWDPMLALMAIIGDENEAGYDTVCGTASVNSETGENNFIPCSNGRHKYVKKRRENQYYREIINKLIK